VSFYWVITYTDTGELVESSSPFSTVSKALKDAKRYVSEMSMYSESREARVQILDTNPFSDESKDSCLILTKYYTRPSSYNYSSLDTFLDFLDSSEYEKDDIRNKFREDVNTWREKNV
jgi:hypothetical protein